MVVQLGSSGGSLAPELVESLGYPQAAPESERALMRLGDPAVRALIGGLRARSTDVRAQAARVLRQFLPEHAVCITPLIRALGDPRSNVRKEAASSLGEARAEQDQVMRALLPRSRDDSAEVRAAVLASLGRLRANSPEAMDVLRAGLSDLIPLVRLEAAKALWTLTEDAAVVVPVLSGVLPTQEGWQAAYALGNIGPAAAAAVPALIEVLKREKVPRAFRTPPSSAFALGQIQEPAIPALKEVLRDRQPGARMAAVLAFNFMGKNARGAVPDLAALLRDPEAEIRNVTAITLAGAGADKTLVLAGLEECLHAEDIYLRSTAAALLREIAPERDWAVSPE